MIVQLPTSQIPPPVPPSMRHHYPKGALDKEGYVRAIDLGPLGPNVEAGYTVPPPPVKRAQEAPAPPPKEIPKCPYCGRTSIPCGCGFMG